MAMRITTEVVITAVDEHLMPESGRLEGHASFREVDAVASVKRITAISGVIPVSVLGEQSPIRFHVGQVWRVQFDYAADQQSDQADEE